jgi:hypothetical protein
MMLFHNSCYTMKNLYYLIYYILIHPLIEGLDREVHKLLSRQITANHFIWRLRPKSLTRKDLNVSSGCVLVGATLRAGCLPF